MMLFWQKAQHHLGQSEYGIFCVYSLAICTCNVWSIMLSCFCQSIGRCFKHSVDTLIPCIPVCCSISSSSTGQRRRRRRPSTCRRTWWRISSIRFWTASTTSTPTGSCTEISLVVTFAGILCYFDWTGSETKILLLVLYVGVLFIFSSPEHEVLMVSYCGQWLSVVRRRVSCVVRRASCVVRQHLMFTL